MFRDVIKRALIVFMMFGMLNMIVGCSPGRSGSESATADEKPDIEIAVSLTLLGMTFYHVSGFSFRFASFGTRPTTTV